jgi:hypothetical protein
MVMAQQERNRGDGSQREPAPARRLVDKRPEHGNGGSVYDELAVAVQPWLERCLEHRGDHGDHDRPRRATRDKIRENRRQRQGRYAKDHFRPGAAADPQLRRGS